MTAASDLLQNPIFEHHDEGDGEGELHPHFEGEEEGCEEEAAAEGAEEQVGALLAAEAVQLAEEQQHHQVRGGRVGFTIASWMLETP